MLGLGREVESQLGTMVEDMEHCDGEVAGRMLGSNVRLKERREEIDEECMVLQALQAPVARDLRFVHIVQASPTT